MGDLNRLNIQHLIYLQALVEERHVTRAAERMGIGQPAMSSALARLRTIFKDVLLVKTTYGMEPTVRALAIVKRIREMTELLEGRGIDDANFDATTSRAHWKIMSSDGISRVVLPELISFSAVAAPEIKFTVHPGDPRSILKYLRDGEFDMVLGFIRSPPSELRQMVLYPQRLVCIASSKHHKIRGQITLREFKEQDHVRWGAPPVVFATMEAIVDEALEAQGVSRNVRLLVSSLTLLPEIVAQSDLIAVVPEQLAWSVRDSLPIQVLALPFDLPSVDVSMLWHERLHHDSAHKWLRDSLREIGRRKTEAFRLEHASYEFQQA